MSYILNPLSLEEFQKDLEDLEKLTKYPPYLSTGIRSWLWRRAKKFVSEEKKEELSNEFEKKYIKRINEIYNKLVYDFIRQNGEEKLQSFEDRGIDIEDRFNPDWYKKAYALWKEDFTNSPYLEGYRKYPTIVCNVAESNISEEQLENFRNSFLENGCDKEKVEEVIDHIKNRAMLDMAQKPSGSCCYGFDISSIDEKAKPCMRVIFLNPYKSGVISLQTMWHETTHWMQRVDEYFQNKKIDLEEKKIKIGEELSFLKEQDPKINENSLLTPQAFEERYRVLDDEMRNYYEGRKLLLLEMETQANLNGSMIAFLKNSENRDKIKRDLILSSNVDTDGGYCDFCLTRDNLDRLENDPNFRNRFLDENGKIKFDELYKYTLEQTIEQTQEIKRYAESKGMTCHEMLGNKKFLEDKNNPVCRMKEEKDKYYEEYPLTRLEKLQEEAHGFRVERSKQSLQKLRDMVELSILSKKTVEECVQRAIADIDKRDKQKQNVQSLHD